MNFDKQSEDLLNSFSEHKWHRISDLILNSDDIFLRKSLRQINKQLYKNYEQISK